MVNYKEYIQSKEWLKKAIKWKKNASCERCKSRYGLTCHHKHYNTLGNESRGDIKVLCWICHKKYHTDIVGNRVNDKEFKERLRLKQHGKGLTNLNKLEDERIKKIKQQVKANQARLKKAGKLPLSMTQIRKRAKKQRLKKANVQLKKI